MDVVNHINPLRYYSNVSSSNSCTYSGFFFFFVKVTSDCTLYSKLSVHLKVFFVQYFLCFFSCQKLCYIIRKSRQTFISLERYNII